VTRGKQYVKKKKSSEVMEAKKRKIGKKTPGTRRTTSLSHPRWFSAAGKKSQTQKSKGRKGFSRRRKDGSHIKPSEGGKQGKGGVADGVLGSRVQHAATVKGGVTDPI